MAVTDANLVLGRLLPAYFPHIFGETEDQPLDAAASRAAFEQLTNEVRQCNACNRLITIATYGSVKCTHTSAFNGHIPL